MRILTYTFILLALVGLVLGNGVAATLAGLWAVLTHYARRVFARQDNAWINDPRNALKPGDTQEILDLEGSECMAMFYPHEVFEAQGQLANPNEDPS